MLAQRGLRYAEALREPDRTRLMLDLLQIQLAANRPANPVETARLIEDLAQRALDHDCLDTRGSASTCSAICVGRAAYGPRPSGTRFGPSW